MKEARTLTELFYQAIDSFGHSQVVMRSKIGGSWSDIGYRELLDRVERTARGLKALGIQPGDRVGILSENRPEWAITDYACLLARCADVPVYPTLPPEQIRYILNDAGAVAVCVSNKAQLEKILEVRDQLPGLKQVTDSPRRCTSDRWIPPSPAASSSKAITCLSPGS